VDAWQTIYYQVLTGEDPVLEWLKGTSLRPLLGCLGSDDADWFLRELASPVPASAVPPAPG
jgi:trans-aconitate 2-methyltransferase